MKNRLFLFVVIITTLSFQSVAQPAKQLVQVIVSPNKTDWTYDKGQQAEFTITVLQNNIPLKGVDVRYTLGPEKMTPWDEGTIKLDKGTTTVKAKRFNEAGFLQCHASVVVDGKNYSSYATAGFSPDKIEPTTTLPLDFEQFWENAKKELANVPMKPVITLLPERCTDKVDVYHVSIDNIKGKIYGILCKPKGNGKYPAMLLVPGAGVGSHFGDPWSAEKGIITFQIGIHGIPVNLDPKVYDNLRRGALDNYWITNLDDKDNFYYKRVYLGCVRAIDFIESLDSFNGEDIAVTGGSQGGAFSIITAALDGRVKYLAALYPALCDLTGYLHNRAGGWPHMFRDEFSNKPEKIEVSKYYDVVNFARFVKSTGWYSWGFNDNVCPPTSMHAAYNVITAPKELYLFPETQHWTFPEQQQQKNDWLFEQLLD